LPQTIPANIEQLKVSPSLFYDTSGSRVVYNDCTCSIYFTGILSCFHQNQSKGI
jgi:hypothetical protein